MSDKKTTTGHIGVDSPNLYQALGLTFTNGFISPKPKTPPQAPKK